ncbi:uncharacterized protein B0P05DRAFT_512031 [Gilbertella persicaria]|uniref:uncharacterized protein n=1 Tax=Gilbertella persicaria TaxID=101096 RepID=UPI002220A2CB|nr:uncharacterized protein B0P05DRAFT_512031 [Gilbertella persicaria]KAI8076524.1 hypothetical protein B0P05DRAFT_512031 [Gilbertella persicaria]
MGVQGLWSLVGPVARPTQLESLRRKRVAVDASIWIHQFMRTMRDKEGQALRNGHLLGFFRRICKLLFFDIKPVFVFDGGAPSLKRNTIRERRKRREGIKTNLKATARKILSAQVKSRVLLEQEKKQRGETMETSKQDFVYYDELQQSAVEALQKKRKLDQFELPNLEKKEFDSRLQQLDPRFATADEIKDFVQEFKPSDLDIDSEAFLALPPEVQYEVIQDLMWKSRSTSWARLDQMVRNSETALDFSKQQIKLLKHRNAMTQRLMQASTMQSGAPVEPVRIAGERGRQYMLYKNENIQEGLGWKLPGLSAAQPVEIDTPSKRAEPKLEVPLRHEVSNSIPTKTKEPEDKVAAALSSNPKLAGLFDDLLSDDDKEEEEFEQVDTTMHDDNSIDKDEPLFMSNANQNNKLVDDMDVYVLENDDEALDKVISRIYDQDEAVMDDQQQQKEDVALSLNSEDLYELWLSRVPDAFIYLFSFNDEYKKMIRRAIEESNLEKINEDLQDVRKQFSRTSDNDELALEALQFQESFLECVQKWKARQLTATETFDTYSSHEDAGSIKLLSDTEDLQDNIILDDDEEEEDIHFVEIESNDANQDKPIDSTKNRAHIQIDMDKSLLRADKKPISNEIMAKNNDNVQQEIIPVYDKKESELPNQSKEQVAADSKEKQAIDSHEEEQIISNDDSTLVKQQTFDNRNEEVMINNQEEADQIYMDMVTEHQIANTSYEPAKEHHGYNSEDELEESFGGEHDEFARFVSDIASKNLDDIRSELYRDMKELNKQKRKEMGNSDDVTDQMVQDIQELLKLFGIPYIVSPMEAEAQCAELERLSLVDGTITDDSDVFLFGALHVYKNMFNQQKYVECYISHDIERNMLLTRQKLIQLAFLLGSDYTEGIPGVGPVAAMEILSEFSQEDEELETPLERFKDWYLNGEDTTPFQKKFRKRHNTLDIPSNFPDPLVKNAYYHPTVDHSTQKFEWGQPQLDSLRIFLMEAFGWPEKKADEVLLPVLREMNSRKVCIATGEQSTIGSFFNTTSTLSSGSNEKKHSSKRVQSIVDNWRKQKKSKK